MRLSPGTLRDPFENRAPPLHALSVIHPTFCKNGKRWTRSFRFKERQGTRL